MKQNTHIDESTGDADNRSESRTMSGQATSETDEQHGSVSPCKCKACVEYRRYLEWKKRDNLKNGPTPITDAAEVSKYEESTPRCVVPAEFARNLERQLAEAREQLKWKQRRIEVLQRVGSKLVEQRNRLANAIINAADVLAAVKEHKG